MTEIKPEFTTFEVKRIEYLLAQAEKQGIVGLGGGDSTILKKLLEVINGS